MQCRRCGAVPRCRPKCPLRCVCPLQVEAGMLVHRAARKGLITFQLAVPFYGLAVLPLLTVLPMGCLFWWRQADISFWSFLFI